MNKDEETRKLIAMAHRCYLEANGGFEPSELKKDIMSWLIKRKIDDAGLNAAARYITGGELWDDLALKMGD